MVRLDSKLFQEFDANFVFFKKNSNLWNGLTGSCENVSQSQRDHRWWIDNKKKKKPNVFHEIWNSERREDSNRQKSIDLFNQRLVLRITCRPKWNGNLNFGIFTLQRHHCRIRPTNGDVLIHSNINWIWSEFNWMKSLIWRGRGPVERFIWPPWRWRLVMTQSSLLLLLLLPDRPLCFPFFISRKTLTCGHF